ncbi:hypothetical protein M0Q50_06030 [bacterium]|jgi:hypothetical protein|nr:hypothetical protein [bacterium]
MKFKYSPGLIGYGTKGTNGTDGLQGMSIYFTDYDPVFNKSIIELAIVNNNVIWSSFPPNTKLPNDRKYITGDLFIDSRGFVYQIDTSSNTFTYTNTILTKGNYYETSKQSTNDFERWYNKCDVSLRGYLIDNTKLNLGENYAQTLKIYDTSISNFTRIEHNSIPNDINYGLSLYSSAEQILADDDKCLAIIFDPILNSFRIGNINEDSSIRNTSLTLDISTLSYNKANVYSLNESLGTILTNKEISTNLLYNNNFISSPSTFVNAISDGNQIIISWKLSDFTQEENIKGNLYFYKDISYNNTYNLNNSTISPIVMYDIDSSGSVTINNLDNGSLYTYYMSIEKDGWEKESNKISIINSPNSYYMTILNPLDKTLDASSDGTFNEDSSSYLIYPLDISMNVPTTWNATTDASFISLIGTTNGASGTFTLDVSLSAWKGSTGRAGSIIFSSLGVPTQYITIIQRNLTTTVQFTADGSLYFSPTLTDQNVTINFKLYAYTKTRRGIGDFEHYADTITSLYKQDNIVKTIQAYAETNGLQLIENDTSINYTMTSINASTKIYGRIQGTENGIYSEGPDCYFGNGTNFMEGMGWIEIMNVTKNNGSGVITPGLNKYWYFKRTITGCSNQLGVMSTQPLSI